MLIVVISGILYFQGLWGQTESLLSLAMDIE